MVRSPRSGREQAVGAQRDRLGTDRLTVGRGVLCSMSRRPRAGHPGQHGQAAAVTASARGIKFSMVCVLYGPRWDGSGGVTGATGAAVWGALQLRPGVRAPAGNGVDFLSNLFLFWRGDFPATLSGFSQKGTTKLYSTLHFRYRIHLYRRRVHSDSVTWPK